MPSRLLGWRGAISGSPNTPAVRCWWSTRLIVRFHAAIRRIARIVDGVSGPGPDDYRYPLDRLRRTGTRRPDRDRGDRAAPLWSYLSDRGQSRRKRAECPSVLQMGGRRATEGCAALELSQISGRPRWLYRRGIP